jgi:hypothetical protein
MFVAWRSTCVAAGSKRSLLEDVRWMEGLGHILDRMAATFDLDQLCSGRRPAPDGNGGFAATEVASDERDKLFVCLAIYGR